MRRYINAQRHQWWYAQWHYEKIKELNMLRRNPSGHMPNVSETAFIDPTAIICGKVIIEDNVFIGPYAVIRADEVNEQGDMEAIVIKRDTNIQDLSLIHI